MTIVVATTAADGIVLATDSRTTLHRGPLRYRVGTDYAHKIFVPFQGIGIATYGTAVLGARSVVGLMEKFVAEKIRNGERPSPNDLAELIAEFFGSAIEFESAQANQTPDPGILGFVVAGYDSRGVGQVLEVLLPASPNRPAVIHRDISTVKQGAIYRGRARYIRRILDGWEAEESLAFLKEQLRDNSDSGVATLRSGYEKQFGLLANPPASLQDAVDYSCFVVRMTIDMERFTDGVRNSKGDVPICGGRVQALVVTRGACQWVIRNDIRLIPTGSGERG